MRAVDRPLPSSHRPASPARLLYGVHGYGRGHAARAQAVLPELSRRYDVRVLAGDDAYDQLAGDYPCLRIPTLRYHRNRLHRRSAWRTILRNTPAALDLLLQGPTFQMVADEIRRFDPTVVLSDSEGWTLRAARHLGLPRISFDHYGVLVYCHIDMPLRDRVVCGMEAAIYRVLVARPERAVAAAFFDCTPRGPGVRVVGPILRQEVRRVRPRDGEHLLVYFSNAEDHYTEAVEQALAALDRPVRVYGLGEQPPRGKIEFRPAGNLPFLEDLASCRAVFSTAGNQLISEALYFRKPLLLMPEDSLEQRLNARIVQRRGQGMWTASSAVSKDLLRTFLDRREEFVAHMPASGGDGLADAVAAIDDAVRSLRGPAEAHEAPAPAAGG